MKKIKAGDSVRFDYIDEQIEKEREFQIPFTVLKVEKKDLYSSGLPMENWEDIATVVDANGKVVAEIEDFELILLDSPQIVPTVEMDKLPVDHKHEDLEDEEEFEGEDERCERLYGIKHPDSRDREYEEDAFDYSQIGL
ncbi:MAG: hypothetical protein NTX85_03970 [Candidatus Nomurabacteria bacterium]|nr:hypothetical protein [Candidatus Nomurabacteria bacterium]